MLIGVIGGGVVGHATARAFMEHVEDVRVYDVVDERSTHGGNEVLECDLIFVCLPTPQKAGALACDTSIVEGFFAQLQGGDKRLNFVLRSTVPIGTTRRLREQYNLPNLVHSPEFLTARCAVTDAQMPARNIIGATGPAGGNPCAALLATLYRERFPGVSVHVMSSDESEAVKLFQNSFFAVKVAFWNECYDLCQKRGMNWESVLAAVLADGRIAHAHTKVPGPDGKRGFGGECLPKDLANLIQCMCDAETCGPGLSVCNAARLRNNHLDRRANEGNGETVSVHDRGMATIHKNIPCDEFLCLPEKNPHHYEQVPQTAIRRKVQSNLETSVDVAMAIREGLSGA